MRLEVEIAHAKCLVQSLSEQMPSATSQPYSPLAGSTDSIGWSRKATQELESHYVNRQVLFVIHPSSNQ